MMQAIFIRKEGTSIEKNSFILLLLLEVLLFFEGKQRRSESEGKGRWGRTKRMGGRGSKIGMHGMREE